MGEQFSTGDIVSRSTKIIDTQCLNGLAERHGLMYCAGRPDSSFEATPESSAALSDGNGPPPIDPIKFVSRIDFTKGFESFHFRWYIGSLNERKTHDFYTDIEFEMYEVTFAWFMEIKLDEPMGKKWFGLNLRSPMSTVPVIYRISLMTEETEDLFDHTTSALFQTTSETAENGWETELEIDQTELLDSELSLHLQMDIPKSIAYASAENSNRTDDDKKKNLYKAATSETLEAILDSTNPNPDPNSDVTVAVLTKRYVEGGATFWRREDVLREFQCHSAVLMAFPTLFDRMLDGNNWLENVSVARRRVVINNIDEKVIEIILAYLYTFECPDSSTDFSLLVDVIHAAIKYDLDELKNHCVSIIIAEHERTTRRVYQLKLAQTHKLVQLEAVCIAQLSMAFLDICDSIGYRKIRHIMGSTLFHEIGRKAKLRQFVDIKLV